jgi:hypothetical protein
MVKIMDVHNSSKARDGFWKAYRACTPLCQALKHESNKTTLAKPLMGINSIF